VPAKPGRDDEPDGQGEFDDPAEHEADEPEPEPVTPVLVCAVCGLPAGTCGHQPNLVREEYPQ
jgi:hypothetical protein